MVRFLLRNDSAHPADEVVVIFSVRRGDLAFRSVQALDGSFSVGAKTGRHEVLGNRGLRLRLGRSVPAGQVLGLDVRTGGEGIRMARTTWAGANGKPTAVAENASLASDAPASWDRISAWRQDRAASEPDLFLRKGKLFFNALDVQTTAEARSLWRPLPKGDPKVREEALLNLPVLLMRGLRDRAAGLDFPYRLVRDVPSVRAWAQEVSDAFRDAYAQSGLRLADLADVFDLFARSALVLARRDDQQDRLYRECMLPACQPNSPNLFLFAEFADLCDSLSIDPGFWEPLRYTLVYIQKVFHDGCKPLFGVDALAWNITCAHEPPATIVDLPQMRAQRAQFFAAYDLHSVWRFNVRRRVQRPPVV
jgi:hypothetical protein